VHIPAQPGLYLVDTDSPMLSGTRCATCGRTSFPPLTIGCDACGAAESALEAASLPTTGEVHSFALVCVHQGQPVEPFVVMEVRLDSGPLIRAVAIGGAPAPQIGDRVAAVWKSAQVDEAGNEVVEPVFAPLTP
jgi:uncharacterized protein